MIYSPKEDSFLLEKQVKKYAKGRRVLDVGSGSGIQAEAALNAEAKSVLATDIDNDSIALLRKKGINCIKSDLFEKVKGKFDLIIFNPPYLPYDKREDVKSACATSGGKRGDEIIVKFLKSAPLFLEKKGIILLVVSSLTPLDKIEKIFQARKLKEEVVAEEKFFMEKIEVWKIERKI